MRNTLTLSTAALLAVVLHSAAVRPATAVELLISGNFETPGAGVGDIPGFTLEEFATGGVPSPINTADLTGDADAQLFLRAFEGGGPLHEAQGNFNNDGLPAGNVDGGDFLFWQRNQGIMSGGLPSQGDTGSPGDGKIDGGDLQTWKNNYGKKPAYVNARLSQTVPGAAGQTYTFQGTSTFEDNYSGFVNTLGSESPFGTIPSPTTTTFRLEFLNGSNAVIGSKSLNLKTEQTFPGFPVVHTPITDVAPAGTVNVRVVAEALNMAYNGTSTSNGALQSAFFNDFNLHNGTNPGTNLLTNGDLNAGVPDALDFWNQQEGPDAPGMPFTPQDEILRTPIASFSNHTPGGSRGVWLSAFFGSAAFGGHPGWSTTPITGTISQTVTAAAGGSYTFSGWTKFEANYSGGVDTIDAASPGPLAGTTSPTQTVIKLDFLDINSVVIGSAVIDTKAARRLLSPTANANDNQWYQHTLMATAPAGTRFARLTAQMAHGVFNKDPGQSAFFDDFSLNGPAGMIAVVPEPASLAGFALGAIALAAARRRARR